MTIDFKNKKIIVIKGTTPSQLFDFLKTIIYEDIQNFTLEVENTLSVYPDIATPRKNGFIDGPYVPSPITPNPYIPTPNTSNPYVITCTLGSTEPTNINTITTTIPNSTNNF